MDVANEKLKNRRPPPQQVHKAEIRHKFWIGGYALLALACLATYFLLRLHIFDVLGKHLSLFKKAALGGFFVFVVLVIARFVEMTVNRRSQDEAIKYNMLRVIHLVSILLIIIIIVSFLFQHWYTAAVSLGLISLILGFALQTPISSFIGWVYIVFRSPYQVGDRIKIDPFTGDVVEISYLDTTLWETGGDYLSNDMPSGRLIRFPNSLVFGSAIYNYTWDKFPFIWNELPFHIAYESDLQYVENTLRELTKNELGPDVIEKTQHLKELISRTAVDEQQIRKYPFVSFRTNDNTWLQATVTYLVEPQKAAAMRSRILKSIIAEFQKNEERVMFPKGDSR